MKDVVARVRPVGKVVLETTKEILGPGLDNRFFEKSTWSSAKSWSFHYNGPLDRGSAMNFAVTGRIS